MIPFLDLSRESRELEQSLRTAVDEVLAESRFVGGDAVASFEAAFAQSCGARHAVGVGSGTDAITFALAAMGVGAGDEVITVANTCLPTVAGIVASGATPVLVDAAPRTLLIDVDAVRAAIGPRTRAIVPVHLYGRRAELPPLGLRVLEDAAQAHGIVGIGDVAAFSFYPTKNLGALGDAGAVVTSDDEVAERVRRLRADQGGRSRLDTIQAAALLAKLPLLARWNARRLELAQRYDSALRDGPVGLLEPVATDVHHLYVVRSRDREGLRARLQARGVETLVHYPHAVHEHAAWSELARGELAESERAAAEVLSLPLYPQLSDAEADAVIEAVLAG